VRPSDQPFAGQIALGLRTWEGQHGVPPGLTSAARVEAFVGQLVASDRRRRFIEHYQFSNRLTARQADPGSGVFDPYAAAVLANRNGDIDDALWLVFLATHFSRHRSAKWRYVTNVYGALGQGRWDWHAVVSDISAFRSWLLANVEKIRGPKPRGFGNHRKYESLTLTGAVAESYVDWIDPSRGHTNAFARAVGGTKGTTNNSADQFDILYRSMDAVYRFGRLARLDYLTTAYRLGIIGTAARRPYVSEASGPLTGARLLFGALSPADAELSSIEFGSLVGIDFAVLEDALCNWQKSPDVFIRFSG
jgi:hypothetical protein